MLIGYDVAVAADGNEGVRHWRIVGPALALPDRDETVQGAKDEEHEHDT